MKLLARIILCLVIVILLYMVIFNSESSSNYAYAMLRATDTRWPTATEPGEPVIFSWPVHYPFDNDAEKWFKPYDYQTLIERMKRAKFYLDLYGDFYPITPSRYKPPVPTGGQIPSILSLAIIAEESRGNLAAHSCRNAVGLFQIIPSDNDGSYPKTCPGTSQLVYPNRPTTAQLETPEINIPYGIADIRDKAWFAYALVNKLEPFDKTMPEYIKFIEGKEYSNLDWWFSEYGIRTLAMNLCGPTGVTSATCYDYSFRILYHWIPWVKAEVLEES